MERPRPARGPNPATCLDCKAFVKGCRRLRITPHVASKAKGSAIDGRKTRHEGYRTSLKVRKRIE